MSPGTRIAYLVLALAVIASFLYYYARIVTVIPGRYIVYLDAALVVASSIVVLRALRPVVRGMAGRAIGGSGASLATFILDSVVYFLMAAAVLSLFGINVYQVILGSAFLAAVLGLATQSVLSNLLTGLMIEVARPFRVGDDVFISTATSGSNYMTFQYPVIAPKYFSSDGMYSQGVRGRVVNISLNYTYLQSADGTLTVIPNGNMVYGAVALLGKARASAIRYEVPKSVDPVKLRSSLEGALCAGIQDGENRAEILIDETTLNTYVILIRLWGDMREQAMNRAMAVMEGFRARPMGLNSG
ncbi:hypothetical protein GCM10007108_03250 [Thermogymnomonas acidicola]|uniref:Mechanosensitive ion channel MscS domain-containing protein n=1 Tax=Thermogymnomonas acidicola TaxID=399579 RepID=A0AA37BQ74_9ARCH|nr:mechanosensitive ion channel family protein [Thermogymnomonas acidicola]GGM68484.1 hypothetical protein GCM10007108_03250 [Thermogymnomonas acidicola]